jgi:hypothetical protein
MTYRNHGLQRSLLLAEETPTTHFIEEFKVSNRLRKSLNIERKSSAPAQVKFLKMREQQHTYVDQARKRELPPIDRVFAHQERLCELRRDAHHLGPKAAEYPDQHEKRLAKRDAYLASRKTRHDDAVEKYNRGLDRINDECEVSVNEATKRANEYLAKTDAQIEDILCLLEKDTADLGQRPESDIQAVKPQIEAVIEARRQRINGLQNKLEEVDKFRKKEAEALMLVLAESLRHASHMSLEEVTSLVEDKSSELNNMILENQKATRTLTGNLLIKTLDASKEYKKRWHAGLVLWREQQPKPPEEEPPEEEAEDK